MTGMEEENNSREIIVEITDAGQLKISGPVVLKDLKRDFSVDLKEVTLCLCGRSKNKPYCDDSHNQMD